MAALYILSCFLFLMMAVELYASETILIDPWIRKQITLNDREFKIYEFDNKRASEEQGDIILIFQNSIVDPSNVLIYLSLDDIVYDKYLNLFSGETWQWSPSKDKKTEMVISKSDPNNINNHKYYILFNKKFSNYFTIANELDSIKLPSNEFIFIEKVYSKQEIIVEFTNEDYNIFIIRTYSSDDQVEGTIELVEKDSGKSLFTLQHLGMKDEMYVNRLKEKGKTYLIYVRTESKPEISLRFAIDMMTDMVVELMPESIISRYYVSNNEYDFYVDISKYNENEENTIQILLEQSNDYEEKKLVLYAKQIQCQRENIENQFDFTRNEFPIGLTTNQYDKKTATVYFKKTRTETENIYLLLRVKINHFGGKAQKIKIVLTKRIEIIRLDGNNPVDIMKTIQLKAELPVYIKVQFNPSEINKKSNIVFRSFEQNVQNITFGHLITDQTTENKLTIQNQLYVLQRNVVVKESNDTITFKYTNVEEMSVTFEIAFVEEELIYMPNVLIKDTLPIEMINCSKALYIIGCYDSFKFPPTVNYTLYFEQFYGNVALRHKNRLDFNGRFVDILPNTTNSIQIKAEHLELDNQINLLKLTCSTPSRVSLHFFIQETPVDNTEILTGDTLLFLLNGGVPLRLRLKVFLSQYLFQIKSINRRETAFSIDEKNYKIDADPYAVDYKQQYYSDKICYLSFSSNYDTLIYLRVGNQSDFNIIVDGNTDITAKNNIIKLKHFEKNEYEYAKISITPKSSLSLVEMRYDFGITKENFIYHPQHLTTLEKEWVILLSNPYHKANQKINEENKEYYYFAIEFICKDKDFLVFVEYSFISETIEANLSMSDLSSVVLSGNQYRMPYDKEKGKDNDYVVMSINQCSNKSEVDIKYDIEKLKNIRVEDKRSISHLGNYEIDMKISLTPIDATASSIGMNYFFSTQTDYQEYQVNSNYTILAKDNGRELNLKWHPYITNHPYDSEYAIYISSPGNGSIEKYDNFCEIFVIPFNESFVLKDQGQLVTETRLDGYANEKLNEVNITIRKGGKYYINIIGHGKDNFPIITSYDAIEIEILRPFNWFLWSIVAFAFMGIVAGLVYFIIKYIKKKKLREEILIDNSIEPFPDEINNNKATFMNEGNSSGSLTDKLV